MTRARRMAAPPAARTPGGARVAVLQTALEHMDEGFSVFDERLRLTGWNERFFRLLDLPLSLAYVGAPFEDFMRFNAQRGEYGLGDPEALVRERVENARRLIPHCFERLRPNGTILEVRGNPIPGVGFVTVYKDITERKRAEKALTDSVDNLECRVRERTAALEAANARMRREIAERQRANESLAASEKWIRLVANAVPVLIGYVDTDTVYRFANQHYERWFGFKLEQVIGKRVREVLPRPLYPEQFADLDLALAGHHITREFAFEKFDGQSIEAAVNYLPHFDEGGRVLGYFVLGQDIAERKRAEATLRQAQKMEAVGQLTGGLAHDFNNLLTIIMGNLALVREYGALPANEADMIHEALDATRRGADLVKRLLAFSRRKALRSEVYDPKRIVVDMHALLNRTLGDDIELSIQLSGADWSVASDPSELENALLNMALNSRDAMPGGGRLTITVGSLRLNAKTMAKGLSVPPGEYVLIAMSDTGCGMPPEVQERAFEPFFTSKGPGQGTGLGLSMVYGFAQRSGGAARISSEVGKGATIELYLPRQQRVEAAAPAASGRAGRAPRGRERILLVEDETRVRAFVRRTLVGLGYEVTDVANGRQALEVLAGEARFHLLLTDVEMPDGISGIDLARAIAQEFPRMSVLMMSGHPDRAIGRGEPLNPQWEILPKPFEKNDLAHAVRLVLDRAGPAAAKRRGT